MKPPDQSTAGGKTVGITSKQSAIRGHDVFISAHTRKLETQGEENSVSVSHVRTPSAPHDLTDPEKFGTKLSTGTVTLIKRDFDSCCVVLPRPMAATPNVHPELESWKDNPEEVRLLRRWTAPDSPR